MWRSGGRGLSRQLRRVVVKATPLQAHGGQFRVVAAAEVTSWVNYGSDFARRENGDRFCFPIWVEMVELVFGSPGIGN